MSVYITILHAKLAKPSKKELAVKITTNDTTLLTNPVPSSDQPTWNSSFVAQIKEKKVTFDILEGYQQKVLGTASYYPNDLIVAPNQQIKQVIQTDNGDKIHLKAFYNDHKNFIGPIEFYELGGSNNYSLQESIVGPTIVNSMEKNRGNETTNLRSSNPGQTNLQNSKLETTNLRNNPEQEVLKDSKQKNFFVCCEGQYDDKQYTIEKSEKSEIITTNYERHFEKKGEIKISKQVEFYKGPCKTKNAFSCCDANLEDQEYVVVEQYYRDREEEMQQQDQKRY